MPYTFQQNNFVHIICELPHVSNNHLTARQMETLTERIFHYNIGSIESN